MISTLRRSSERTNREQHSPQNKEPSLGNGSKTGRNAMRRVSPTHTRGLPPSPKRPVAKSANRPKSACASSCSSLESSNRLEKLAFGMPLLRFASKKGKKVSSEAAFLPENVTYRESRLRRYRRRAIYCHGRRTMGRSVSEGKARNRGAQSQGDSRRS